MDRHTSFNSSSIGAEEQEEPLYCSALQNPEDIIYQGSDTEQTVQEVRDKRRRYEGSARRYLGGHIPIIQSASLRGPLHRESGWVNPWRYRPPKEADWWQPGSQDMLFTRENVMRRATDHGLGYLTPAQALAWCKAAAETEARKELDQFDSMEAVQSGESDVEDVAEELLTDDHPKGQSDSSSQDDGHQTNPDATNPNVAYAQYTDRRNTDNSTDSDVRGIKRPAELQWLKGSYVSKRARWEDPPISSPTPMPDQHNERDQRRRQNSAGHASSENGRPNPMSQPKTPWSHEAQQRTTVSRYSGSTAQGPELKDSGRSIRQQLEDMDELQEDSRDTTFVSATDFLSGSQGKAKRAKLMDRLYLDLESDDLTVISARNTSINTPAARSGTSASKKSGSGSSKLPKLHRSPKTRVDVEFVEDDSFITEFAPSSRNLEKFQYRKKRRKSKKRRSRERHEDSHEQFENATRPSPEQAPADEAEEFFTNGLSVTINPAQQSTLEMLEAERSKGNEDPETAPARINVLRSKITLSLEDDVTRMQGETSLGKASSQFDESYLKKVVIMPDNVLPSFGVNSPFAPFEPMAFGSFGASKATPSPPSASANRSAIVKDGQRPASTLSANIALDVMPAPSLDKPENRDPAMIASHTAADPPLQRHTQSSHSPTSYVRSFPPDDHRQVVDASISDRDTLPMSNSASREVEELEQVLSSNAWPDSPEKPDLTLKPVEKVASHTQETRVDDDSTQSFNSTAFKSLRKPRRPAETARNILIADEDAIKDDKAKLSNKCHQDETPRDIAGKTASHLDGADAKSMGTHFTQAAGLPEEEAHDEMEIIQNALSQNCSDLGSNSSSQLDNDRSSQPSGSAANTELEPGRTTPPPEEEDDALAVEEEQDSWEGCGPQSPWAAENLLPEPTSNVVQLGEPFVTVEREASVDIGGSPPRPTFGEASDWQTIERPVTPDNDGIRPSIDLMSPTPSSELVEVHAEQDVVSNTQLLIDAATNNPWTSNYKKRPSGKSKKRVSFGVLPSEEKPDSQPEMSSFSKKGPGSPPPPESLGRSLGEDALDDSPIAVGKFQKHFSTAAGFQHFLPRNSGSHALSSPAVGAMADRFIAADRETSTELDRRQGLSESPTRHLRPKSDARTNRSPSEATDHDVEVNLDDFISDAGNFLEDWSVDSEVRKTRGLKEKRESENGQGTRRSLFGLTNVWS